jgi:hypothetical protein
MKNILFGLLLITSAAFGQSSVYYPYCHPAWGTSLMRGSILNVSIGSMSNTTGHTTYKYYDNITPPVLYRDSTYILSVEFDTVCPSCGTSYPDNSWYAIGIPFDSSTNYTTFITSIRFYREGGVGSGSTSRVDTFHVTVPHTANLGITRLRVARWGKGNSSVTSILPALCSPTLTAGIGETEDYDLKIEDAPPISLQVQPFQIIKYSVFPNPTTGILHIDAPTGLPLRIFNTIGQVVVSEISKPEIDISSLPNGIYYLSINGVNQMIQKR